MKILIIEDEVLLREIISRALYIEGETEIRFRDSLHEAYITNQLFQPHLTILDLMLTDSNPEQSTEGIKRLIADNPDGAVMVYSGRITPDIRARALALGARTVLEKSTTSVQRDILQAAIDALECGNASCKTFIDLTKAVLTTKPVEQNV